MHILLIFHKVAYKRTYCVVGYIIFTLLQIVCRVLQEKNFENLPIFGEDIDKSKVPRFLWPMVYVDTCISNTTDT